VEESHRAVFVGHIGAGTDSVFVAAPIVAARIAAGPASGRTSSAAIAGGNSHKRLFWGLLQVLCTVYRLSGREVWPLRETHSAVRPTRLALNLWQVNIRIKIGIFCSLRITPWPKHCCSLPNMSYPAKKTTTAIWIGLCGPEHLRLL
jgi:hypothetical protein